MRFDRVLLAFGCLSIWAMAGEYSPKSIWTDAETFSERSTVDKMFDGDGTTYSCLLDTTRLGTNPNVSPKFGKAPVTAVFVMDMGETREWQAVRFVMRNRWVNVGPKNVSLFTCSDPQGTEKHFLRENVELPPRNNSDDLYVTFEPAKTRYLGVQVNDSYQKNCHIPWWGVYSKTLSRRGDTLAGDGKNLNIQIAEVTVLDELPKEMPGKNAPETAFPKSRLVRDWMYQDVGLDIASCFLSKKENRLEAEMTRKVFSELTGKECLSRFEKIREELLSQNVPGCDHRWKELYVQACKERRKTRLAYLAGKTSQFVYVKHHVLGGMSGLSGKYDVTDEQIQDFSPAFQPGGQLCILTLHEDGSVTNEVILEKPEGAIYYPNLSYDGRTLVFSMRDNFKTDDYHLYTMDMQTREIRQITFSPQKDGKTYPCADSDPCFLPNGEILFASTRCVQINDCWLRANSDLYVCKPDGRDIRRLTFDQLDTNYPQVMEDGRILYTRWEYNDRNAYHLHPLFSMNPDGTAQTEYYGNNATYPASLLQSRGIPGSSKIVTIVSGHHVLHKGKLALLDQREGVKHGRGIEYVAGASPDRTPGRKASPIIEGNWTDFELDIFGQDGPQFSFPFAFDEEHYVVSFQPEGFQFLKGPLSPPFGAYFMDAEGKRELLAFDRWQGTGGIVPVMKRTPPPMKFGGANAKENWGVYYVQNVYLGPGLEGVEPGTIRQLRVVAMEYRPARMGVGHNDGETGGGSVQTPVSFNNGSWDVKHVLGVVDVEPDGSCCFQVPARTPVYFQLLDEKGWCVQTMRSWSTLQGGETFACLGCHENKNDVLMTDQRKPTLAMRKPPQKLQPFAGKTHPFLTTLNQESGLASVENYLGVNRPCDVNPTAPVNGFSYTQEIQPILDRHCVKCHAGEVDSSDPEKRSKLCLTGEVVDHRPYQLNRNSQYKRAFTRSYLALTTNGLYDENPWVQWIDPRGRAEMLPPRFTGSPKSPLMNYLEPSHYNVQLSDDEKRTVACWIDLAVPFCGSYAQANTWTDSESRTFQYFLDKRRFFAEEERKVLAR
ncbi:MAG: hypothetical protein Q4D98_07270 [Planctomycetia bacterium]|nr:hypothetical protein [Planctomycetia bacterium]